MYKRQEQKTVKPTYLCPLGARKLAEGKGHETASLLRLTQKTADRKSEVACSMATSLAFIGDYKHVKTKTTKKADNARELMPFVTTLARPHLLSVTSI